MVTRINLNSKRKKRKAKAIKTDPDLVENKIVAAIEVVLEHLGKPDGGIKFSWIVFRKKYDQDKNFGDSEIEISKSDLNKNSNQEEMYLVEFDRDVVFNAKYEDEEIKVATLKSGTWLQVLFKIKYRLEKKFGKK